MITLSPKDPSEIISLSFDFSALLAVGETLSAPSLNLSVLHGVDADVGSMLTGVSIIAGGIVSHLVRVGVDTTDYLATCLAATSQGQTLKLSGILPVRVQA
jgi:hypothetical protein